MKGRKHSESVSEKTVERKSFDDFELRLGDVMRGERATMGKSLLDVQRELRIKAAYIAAIENCDPEAFDTPGFIAGYVRSYARYLGMNPDEVYETFCAESGFTVAHGMSAKASVVRKPNQIASATRQLDNSNIFDRPGSPFLAQRESVFSRIEPGAIGSMVVLLALIAGIGFGGYTVLQEVQRVQVAPVDKTPVVLSDLDPLEGALISNHSADVELPDMQSAPQRAEAFDRLYKPQALDVPVLVVRDTPISTIAPGSIGNFASFVAEEEPEPAGKIDPGFQAAINKAIALSNNTLPVPQVVESRAPSLRMVAVRPAWVRVRAADGSVILETIMEPGETWDAPVSEEAPTLRTGESGAVYFSVNGEVYGPVGATGTVTSNVALSVDSVKERFALADLSADKALATTVAELPESDTDIVE
ncbi:MAG: helix-turn-helix domain-containing protein [Pseudomonadota bacterium]